MWLLRSSFFLCVWGLLFGFPKCWHELSKPQFWLNIIKAPLFFQRCLCAFLLEKQGFLFTQPLLILSIPRVLGSSASISGEIPITLHAKASHPTPREITWNYHQLIHSNQHPLPAPQPENTEFHTAFSRPCWAAEVPELTPGIWGEQDHCSFLLNCISPPPSLRLWLLQCGFYCWHLEE